ncbi:MAG: hypothetical protein WD872_13115 [Pirellulaceae bacterium]
MIGALGVSAVLGVFGLFVVLSLVLGNWLLGPVNRAAGRLNAPTRYMLTDFIWLMIQLQIVLAIGLHYLRESTPPVRLVIILTVLCLPIVVLWAASVSVVSRAAIVIPLRRATVILLLVPGALAVIVSVPVLFVLATTLTSEYTRYSLGNWGESLEWQVLSLLGCSAASLGLGFILRWLSYWVLAPEIGPLGPGVHAGMSPE